MIQPVGTLGTLRGYIRRLTLMSVLQVEEE